MHVNSLLNGSFHLQVFVDALKKGIFFKESSDLEQARLFNFFHFDTFISKTKYLHSKRAFALKHFTLQDKDEMVALKH